MYFYGMVFWGISPVPYWTWRQTADDLAAGEALLEHFPQAGTYYLPGEQHDETSKAALYEKGPVAFVHMTAPQGRSMHEPWVLLKGLLLYLGVSALLAMILRLSRLKHYRERVGLIALAGLSAAVMIDVGDTVWWYLPLGWKLMLAFFNGSAWVLGGLVLAYFVKADRAEIARNID